LNFFVTQLVIFNALHEVVALHGTIHESRRAQPASAHFSNPILKIACGPAQGSTNYRSINTTYRASVFCASHRAYCGSGTHVACTLLFPCCFNLLVSLLALLLKLC